MTDLLIYWLHMVKMYPLTGKTNIPIVNVMYSCILFFFVSSFKALDFFQVNLYSLTFLSLRNLTKKKKKRYYTSYSPYALLEMM